MQPGQNLDARFDELVQVGSGSMGTVYKAWDRVTGAHVALKLLHNTATAPRFEREALVLSQIAHPNIVRYVAHGMTATGHLWLAMEWLDGCDLDTYLQAGVLEPGETLRLARALSSGLSWAHDRGFVHRDMKPSNVFIPPSGFDDAKVVDFGLARDVVQEDALTKTGMLIGTLEYMPPEQVSDAKRADARADVYALGAVLFRCLTGKPPAHGNTLPEILLHIIRGTIPPIASFRNDVPAPFAELIESMLQKDAEVRPASATHVALSLDHIERAAHPILDLDAETEMMHRRPSYIPAPTPPPPRASGAPPRRAEAPRVAESPAAAPFPPRPAFPPRPPLPAYPRAPPMRAGGVARFLWWPLAFLAVGVVALVVAVCR